MNSSGPTLEKLTERWGPRDSVSLYLDRCQVDTPDEIVAKVWQLVYAHRETAIDKVVDFGAGDARFARVQGYSEYLGYEIDPSRSAMIGSLPHGATVIQQCAFSQSIDDADVCVGNPPYVRNQDLPDGWRQHAAETLFQRTGVRLSGLANAWQYFFLLSLASTKEDGLVALVVPYEWVSRPSAASLRDYIRRKNWDVKVHRLHDKTFTRVLTTASITLIDKRSTKAAWAFFEESSEGAFRALPSVTYSPRGVVSYLKRGALKRPTIFAKRGLSPGTQRVLVLTEGERVRSGLRIESDVVPCITSMRELDPACDEITKRVFDDVFRAGGRKCWLIRTDREPSQRLRDYLDGVPKTAYQTSTCLNRELWWHFSMPAVPSILTASGFRGVRPKAAANVVGARAVGSVTGIYGVPKRMRRDLVAALRRLRLSKRIVPHSRGLKKLEVHQLNSILNHLETDRQR